jgi:hypothetical protein
MLSDFDEKINQKKYHEKVVRNEKVSTFAARK